MLYFIRVDEVTGRESMKPVTALFILPVLLFLNTGCTTDSYVRQLMQERQETEDAFRDSRTSPFAAVSQVTINDTLEAWFVPSGDPVRLRLANRPPDADSAMRICWDSKTGMVLVSPLIALSGNVDDGRTKWKEYISGSMLLGGGSDAGGESWALQFFSGRTGARVRAFIPSLSQERFKGLDYYPPDPSWRIECRASWFEKPDTISLPTTTGSQKFYLKAALLTFERNGVTCHLTLLTPAESGTEEGFIPFQDLTSGIETYSGGRYVDIYPLPESDRITVDFNRAYNPYCAYSPWYNCPIPPVENTLPIEVTAGEKAYHGGDH